MKLQRNKMQILVCASEVQAEEEHERYMAQRKMAKRHGLPGGLVLFEQIGRVKACYFRNCELSQRESIPLQK